MGKARTKNSGKPAKPARMPDFYTMGKQRRKNTEFHRLRMAAGLGDKTKCAELIGVTERTIANYNRKDSPTWAKRIIQLYNLRDLAGIAPEWQGFTFSRGKLVNAKLKINLAPESLRHWPTIMEKLQRLEAKEQNPPCPYLKLKAALFRAREKLTPHKKPSIRFSLWNRTFFQ